MAKNDWITIWYTDRLFMAKQMRDNLASDIRNGRGAISSFDELREIEKYEQETRIKYQHFKNAEHGQIDAYFELKRTGAIA